MLIPTSSLSCVQTSSVGCVQTPTADTRNGAACCIPGAGSWILLLTERSLMMDPLGYLRNDFQVHLEDGLTQRYICI